MLVLSQMCLTIMLLFTIFHPVTSYSYEALDCVWPFEKIADDSKYIYIEGERTPTDWLVSICLNGEVNARHGCIQTLVMANYGHESSFETAKTLYEGGLKFSSEVGCEKIRQDSVLNVDFYRENDWIVFGSITDFNDRFVGNSVKEFVDSCNWSCIQKNFDVAYTIVRGDNFMDLYAPMNNGEGKISASDFIKTLFSNKTCVEQDNNSNKNNSEHPKLRDSRTEAHKTTKPDL